MTTKKALMKFGNEEVLIRFGDDGCLKKTLRKVRLVFGTHIYCAKRNPGPDDKCQPYSPGYRVLVEAMSGQLLCPPITRDPSTGASRENPLLEYDEDTGAPYRCTATGMAAVRNPVTGEWSVSFQTVIQDARHVFVQALLKKVDHHRRAWIVPSDMAAELRAELNAERDEKTGRRCGIWGAMRMGNGNVVVYNNMSSDVQEAHSTYANQIATLRQRTASKAERLAADHNPVLSRTWHMRDLKQAGEDRYLEEHVIAHTELHDRTALENFMARVATEGQIDGVERVVDAGTVIDAEYAEQPEDSAGLLEADELAGLQDATTEREPVSETVEISGANQDDEPVSEAVEISSLRTLLASVVAECDEQGLTLYDAAVAADLDVQPGRSITTEQLQAIAGMLGIEV